MSLVTQAHADELVRGAAALGVELDESRKQGLLAYLALLAKWNKAYNLTAVRDMDEMVSRHLLDSLSIVPRFIEAGGERWLDVGSGGGMPGIPLAILFPDKRLTLLDSNGKKTRFLTQVKLELKLHNLEVIHSRVEAYQPEQAFNGIVSRAFSSLEDFSNWTRHLGDGETRWLAMKGVHPVEELAALPEDFRVEAEHVLSVPGCQGQRHLLILRRSMTGTGENHG
ncbi:16S rRNA (guanine(527)-N(7))-methyltransferase RsmG [Pseudomonas citronellolis]|uniref:16S rRNA (guanine(527)-N(7))-methyltransferase RsmG n=1 Tax=Pseudomonas citronellolis TaxID=53408 RepID=UPI0023E35212|nr:16S rRNA (guanine(527)-N(7))-methyltransferase RsmG [Pseudomonas citronellolis]MDF3934450.1 16S rRNA (guanine(527)-N(7))-methyltransferase RsmG [Pseudomonas citronellolis]